MCKDLGGNRYECSGTCGASGTVWGTGLYTADSNVFLAAKHMGILPCTFQKVMAPACTAYIGTSMNGVSTTNYGNYGSSYFLIKVDSLPAKPIDTEALKKDIKEITKEELRQQTIILMKAMKK